MAELNQIGVTLSPTKMISNVDNTEMMMVVGNELNRRYYENQEKYLTNIVDPLAKIETNERTEKVVNTVREEIAEKFAKYQENGDYHRMGEDIFEASKYILNHQGLKAAIKDEAEYQAFRKALGESNWDQESQNGILIEALLNSSELKYDKDKNTVTGGFSAVNIGEAFDEEKHLKTISDIISKIKPDEISQDRLLMGKLASQYGLDTITGLDGSTIASHIITLSEESGGITPEKVMKVAKDLMYASTDYKSYLASKFKHKYNISNYDAKTNSLKPLTSQDLMGLIDNPAEVVINQFLKGKDFSVNDIFSVDTKTGKVSLKNKLTEEQQLFVNGFSQLSGGISLTDLLNGDATLSEKLIESKLNEYINDLYKDQSNNGDIDFDKWAYSKLEEDFIFNTIDTYASGMAGIYSHSKYKKSLSLTANSGYTEAVKQAYKNNSDNLLGVDIQPRVSALKTINANTGTHLDRIKAFDQLAEAKTVAVNQNKELRTKIINDYASAYSGLLGVDLTKEENLNNINIPALEKTLYGDYYTTRILGGLVGSGTIDKNTADQLFSTISQYSENLGIIARNEDALKTKQYDYNRLLDIYHEEQRTSNSRWGDDNSYTGFGWYGVADRQALMILDNRLLDYKSYTDYVKYLNNSKGEDYAKYVSRATPYGGSLETPIINTLSKEDYEKTLANAFDNVQNRYNKKHPDKPFEYSTTAFIVNKPHPLTQSYINGMTQEGFDSAGGWYITDSTNGDAKAIAGDDLAPLFNYDTRNIKRTINDKGESITIHNTTGKDLKPLEGKAYGIKGDIYRTETKLLLDPVLQAQGKLNLVINCIGKNGNTIGKVTVAKDVDNGVLADIAINEYLNLSHSVKMGNIDAEQSLNNLASSVTNSMCTFNQVNGNTTPQSVAQLQSMLDKSPDKPITVDINIPMLTDPSKKGLTRRMQFMKIGDKYTIKDVDPDSQRGVFYYTINGQPFAAREISKYKDTQLNMYDDVTQALNPLTLWNLEAFGKLVIGSN